MTAERYAVDVAHIATVTDRASANLDALNGLILGTARAGDEALAVVGAERSLADALEAVLGPRRATGQAMVWRAGEVIAAAQTVALTYVEADADMALTTTAADVSLPSGLS